METALVVILALLAVVNCQNLCVNFSLPANFNIPVCPSYVEYNTTQTFILLNGQPLSSFKEMVNNYTEGGESLIHKCLHQSIQSSSCYTRCISNQRPECTGDDLFCSTHDCPTLSIFGCHCTSINVTKTIWVKLQNDSWRLLDSEPLVRNIYILPTFWEGVTPSPSQVPVPEVPPVRLLGESRGKRNIYDPNTYIDFTASTIVVRTLTAGTKFVSFSKDTWVFVDSFDNQTYNKVLPDEVFYQSGTLYIQVDNSASTLKTASFPIIARVKCDFRDCVLCSEAYANWECLPSRYKFTFVISSIVLLSLCFICTPIGLWSLWFCGKVIVSCGRLFCFKAKQVPKLRILRTLRRKITSPISGIKRQFEFQTEDGEEMMEKGNSPTLQTKDQSLEVDPNGSAIIAGDLSQRSVTFDYSAMMNSRQRRYQVVESSKDKNSLTLYCHPLTLVIMFSFLFLIPIEAQDPCTSGLAIPASIQSCTSYLNGVRNCTVTFNTLASIADVYQSSCFTFLDPVDNTTVLYTVYLDYHADQCCYALDWAYCASSWEGGSFGNYICYDGIDCYDEKCSGTSDSDITAGGKISSPEAIQHPGHTACTRVDGGWTEGCAVPETQACYYQRNYIKPVGNRYKTYELNNPIRSPSLAVVIRDSVRAWDVTINNLNTPTTLRGFEITTMGNLYQMTPTFIDRKLLIHTDANGDTDFQAMCYASDPDNPVAGSIGDIQANSCSDYDLPSSNAFKIASGLYTTTTQSTSVSTHWHSPGFSTIPCRIGPFTEDGNWWRYNNGFFCANMNQAGTLLVELKTTTPFIIQQVADYVCPLFTIVSASGCYNCEQGFKIVINAKSTCAAGTALVRLEQGISGGQELHTTSVNLLQTDQNFDLFGTTGVVVNNLYLTLSSGDSSLTQHVLFTATAGPGNVNPNNNETNGNHTETRGGSGFKNFFKTAWNWFEDLLLNSSWWIQTLIAIVLVVIAGLVLWLISPLLRILFEIIKSVFQGLRKGIARLGKHINLKSRGSGVSKKLI